MEDIKPDRPAADTAMVFEDEEGQAIRLPDGYRFETGAVHIRREGTAFVIEPMESEDDERQRAWDEIIATLGEPFDDDMVEAALNRPGPEDFDRLNCDLRLKD